MLDIRAQIFAQLSSSYSKMVELNQFYIKTIAETILFCAMHDMPLHGHVEDGRTIKNGLFLDFVSTLLTMIIIFRKNGTYPHDRPSLF